MAMALEVAQAEKAAKEKASKEARQKSTNAAMARVVAYQHQQASNGYPSFQFELGKRYLVGDGVETNRSLAIHWLKSACTNGSSEATNLLSKLP